MIDKFKFDKIQQYKRRCYGKSFISQRLQLSRNTVYKYWDMDDFDFNAKSHKRKRLSAIKYFERIIIQWLKENKMLSAAKIRQRLFKQYGELFSERTISRYLFDLRQQLGMRFWKTHD